MVNLDLGQIIFWENALGINCEGFSLEKISSAINEKVDCPKCGQRDFTEARHFNLMFPVLTDKTNSDSLTYLRPETAQSIFIDFKNVLQSSRKTIPFGIAQVGKAFRNEITAKHFIFRTTEFDQMEIEYFIQENSWQETFDQWLQDMLDWTISIGIKKENLFTKEHDEKLFLIIPKNDRS